MNNMFNRYSQFPKHHMVITPSDEDDIAHGPVIVQSQEAGQLTVLDSSGTEVTYVVTAGQILPVLVSRVMATNTDVDVVGLY